MIQERGQALMQLMAARIELVNEQFIVPCRENTAELPTTGIALMRKVTFCHTFT